MDKKQNVWLDIVRSTAIFLVLVGHLRFFLVDLFPGVQSLKFGGFIGVELFFVLSGFLIGDILYKISDNFNYKNINSFLSACAAIVALVFAIFKLLAYVRDSKIKSKLLEQELIAKENDNFYKKWNHEFDEHKHDNSKI